MNRADRRRLARSKTPPAPRVCVATLHGNGGVQAGFADDWTNLLMANHGLIGDIVSISGSLVAAARNGIVRHFLAGSCDWLFMVDDDMRFPPDVLPALLAHADPAERPIVGALCFKVHRDGDVEPTLYRMEFEPNTHLRVVQDWQRGALVQVDATGAACLLVHRSVFEAMSDPWFGSGEFAGEQLGEDTTFCLSARQAGFTIHVASSVDVGHVKPRSFGVADYERQLAERASVPTFVVVPVREAGDPIPVAELGGGIAGIIAVPNDQVPSAKRGACPTNTPFKWNLGMEWARGEAEAEGFRQWNVLVLNDDLVLDVPRVAAQLSRALRADPSYALAYPNVHGFPGGGHVTTHSDEMAGQTFSGYCFMVRGETAEPFDDRYVWWYGDSDYEKRIRRAGQKVVCALDCRIEHLRGNESTFNDPRLLAQAIRDEALFAREWRVDPGSLFLAKNPHLVSSSSAS